MRALCLVLLAACELKPAPKQQPAPPPAAPQQAPKPVEAPPAPQAGSAAGSAAGSGAGSGSGSAAPKIEISAGCLDVGAKVAQVYIDSATDPGQKSIYEQERANMTRKTGEACTTQGWSDQARTCYLATKTPAEIKACEMKFSPPRPPPPPPAPPSGSGAPTIR